MLIILQGNRRGPFLLLISMVFASFFFGGESNDVGTQQSKFILRINVNHFQKKCYSYRKFAFYETVSFIINYCYWINAIKS